MRNRRIILQELAKASIGSKKNQVHFVRLKALLKAHDRIEIEAHILAYEASGFNFFGKSIYAKLLKELLEHYRIKNEKDKHNRVFKLLREITSGDLATVKDALDQGGMAVINIAYPYMSPSLRPGHPLLAALMRKNKDLIELLISHGASLDGIPDTDIILTDQNETPLMIAAELGIQELVIEILQRKVDPNLKRKDGATSLHLAIKAGDEKSAAYLLERGADPNISWQYPIYTAFQAAAFTGELYHLCAAMLNYGYKVKELDLLLIKDKGKNAAGLYQKMKSPLKKKKTRLIERSKKQAMSYTEKLIGDRISKQIFACNARQREFLRLKLNEIYNDENTILRPLLELIDLACRGVRNPKNPITSQKPLKYLITEEDDVSSLTAVHSMGLYKHKNSIFVAGFKNKCNSLMLASFLHESKHFADQEIFGTTHKPFTELQETHFQAVKQQLKESAEEFFIKKASCANLEDKFIYRSIIAIFQDYDEFHQDAEILVKVPEILGFLGVERGCAWLEKHEPALLNFYKFRFNRTLMKHLRELQERILSSEEESSENKYSANDIVELRLVSG